MDDARIDTLIRQIAALTVALQSSSRAPRASIPIPSDRAWIDPVLVSSNLTPRYTNVTGAPGAIELIVGADPNRAGLGMFMHRALSSSVDVAPWPDVDVAMYATVGSVSPLYLDLASSPPLPCLEWYGLFASACSLRVVEIIRLSRSK